MFSSSLHLKSGHRCHADTANVPNSSSTTHNIMHHKKPPQMNVQVTLLTLPSITSRNVTSFDTTTTPFHKNRCDINVKATSVTPSFNSTKRTTPITTCPVVMSSKHENQIYNVKMLIDVNQHSGHDVVSSPMSGIVRIGKQCKITPSNKSTRKKSSMKKNNNLDIPYYFTSMSCVRIDSCTHLKSLSFRVHGNPPVKQRHRIAFRNQSGNLRSNPNCYDANCKFTKQWRNKLQQMLLHVLDMGAECHPCFNDEYTTTKCFGICFTITFCMKRNNKDIVLRDGEYVLRRECPKFPSNKDLDNLVKYIMDALNGIVYKDDKIVTLTISEKSISMNIRKNHIRQFI
jgi:Holliday junction resolvase RusA-like endonuclease